jgi:hypothetical protein
LIVLAVILIVSGIRAGWLVESYILRQQTSSIVLAGSGNVFPFLEERTPIVSDMAPLWLDIGSGGAQKEAFAAFNYGQLIASPERVGFVAMSSNGTRELERLFLDSPQNPDLPSQSSNYWLSIRIAQPPLAILYRGDGVEKRLHVQIADKVPPQGDRQVGVTPYHFVKFDDVRELINPQSIAGVKRYLPEEGAGTRDLINEASKQKLNWPKYGENNNVQQVPDYLEELTDDTFVEIVSYPQHSHKTRKAAAGPELAQLGIKSAVICADGADCDHLIPADYRLIIKLKPEHGPTGQRLIIFKRSECKIAESLVKDISNCVVTGDISKHIVTKVADVTPPPALPAYLLYAH